MLRLSGSGAAKEIYNANLEEKFARDQIENIF